VLLVALSCCDLSLVPLLARASGIFPGNNHADKSHSPIPRRMRNVLPDFGACLTSFAAGFVRPDNGLSSRLEISGPQEKQEKQNNTKSQRQSVQWVGRRCGAAGYDGRAATRPYRLGNVPIIIGKWYKRVSRTHSKKALILQNSAFYPPATSLECFQRRFPTDSRQGVSRNTLPVIPDFSVVSFSPCGVKRW
jgi:hypothetical protein